MNNNLITDFTVDKATKTVSITIDFDAELSVVWDAFTKPEILDQWVAPKPMTSKTKRMEFKVGGQRLYAMVSADGQQEHWALQEYKSVTPKTSFSLFNVFADKDGNPKPPGSDWNYTFGEQNGKTSVHISIYNESLERMEKIVDGGFVEGFSQSIENLKNLLSTLTQK